MGAAKVTRPADDSATADRVSDVLKWVLLVTAVICFALLGWATVLTYARRPRIRRRSPILPATC